MGEVQIDSTLSLSSVVHETSFTDDSSIEQMSHRLMLQVIVGLHSAYFRRQMSRIDLCMCCGW